MTDKFKRHFGGSLKSVALLVFGIVIGSFAVTFAAIPSASGTISACYSKLTGNVKVIDSEAGRSCNNLFENPITLNQPTSVGGTQSAFAYINEDGSLNAANSKGIADYELVFAPADEGNQDRYYGCFKVGFEPRSAYGRVGPQVTVDTWVKQQPGSEVVARCGNDFNAVAMIGNDPLGPEQQIGLYNFAFFN